MQVSVRFDVHSGVQPAMVMVACCWLSWEFFSLGCLSAEPRRQSLPKAWCGLRDDELSKLAEIPGALGWAPPHGAWRNGRKHDGKHAKTMWISFLVGNRVNRNHHSILARHANLKLEMDRNALNEAVLFNFAE